MSITIVQSSHCTIQMGERRKKRVQSKLEIKLNLLSFIAKLSLERVEREEREWREWREWRERREKVKLS